MRSLTRVVFLLLTTVLFEVALANTVSVQVDTDSAEAGQAEAGKASPQVENPSPGITSDNAASDASTGEAAATSPASVKAAAQDTDPRVDYHVNKNNLVDFDYSYLSVFSASGSIDPAKKIKAMYDYLFDPAFIYKTQASKQALSMVELSNVIAHSNEFKKYANQSFLPSTQTYKPEWDDEYIYHEALTIYLQQGVQALQQGDDYLGYRYIYDDKVHPHDMELMRKWQPREGRPFYGTTPLHVAIARKDAKAFEILMKFCAEAKSDFPFGIHTSDALGYTPLHLALLLWSQETDEVVLTRLVKRFIRPLLQAEANPNTYNSRGETILHSLVRIRNECAAPYQACREASMSTQILNGAPQWFMKDVVGKMSTATLNQVDWRGHTALIKMALSWGADDQQDDQQDAPNKIWQRISPNNTNALRFLKSLVAGGAELKAMDEFGRDIAHIVAQTYGVRLDRALPQTKNKVIDYVLSLQMPRISAKTGPLDPELLNTNEQISFLRAVYSNDIKSLANSSRMGVKIGDYVIEKALQEVAVSNRVQVMRWLLDDQLRWRTGYLNGDMTSGLRVLVDKARDAAIQAGSVDGLIELIEHAGVDIQARHLQLAVANQQLIMAMLLLQFPIEVENPRQRREQTQRLVQEIKRLQFPMGVENSHQRIEQVQRVAKEIQNQQKNAAYAAYQYDNYAAFSIPSARAKLVDNWLSMELIPAIQRGDEDMVKLIIHYSPSSFTGTGTGVQIRDIFRAVVLSAIPNANILKILLDHHSRRDVRNLRSSGNIGESMRELWRKQRTDLKPGALSLLARVAAQRPEYIQEYQDIFALYASAVRGQAIEANRLLEGLKRIRGLLYRWGEPLHGLEKPEPETALSSAEAKKFITTFRSAWWSRAQKIKKFKGYAPLNLDDRALATQMTSWEKLLGQHTDPSTDSNKSCEEILQSTTST